MQNFVRITSVLYILFISCYEFANGGEVIYAINAGGESHVDIHGVRYQRDPLHNLVGVASDYGKQLMIMRAPPQDQIIYQTERYSESTFGYDIPINKDGKYVLALKFSEVYFNAPGQKVFDVVVNAQHTVVPDLDIFSEVGRGVAHDEYIPLEVRRDRLFINDEESEFDGTLTVEFIKGYRDNPKVNAIVLMRGELDDMPQLPSLPKSEDDSLDGDGDPLHSSHKSPSEMLEEDDVVKEKRSKISSGPKVQDPYSTDETSSLMMPVIIAIGAFFPLLFCLCKL